MSEEKRVIFLAGRRVELRPLSKSDIPHLMRWINDPEIRNFIANNFPKMEASEEAWLDHLSKSDTDIILAIVTKKGKFIGTMGIHGIKWVDRTATTGALIGEKEYWGKGYGSEAKLLLLNYAFNTLGLRKICSSVIAFNKRSYNYSAKVGYKEEGRLKKQNFRNGKYWDLIQLAIFRKDFIPFWKKYLAKKD